MLFNWWFDLTSSNRTVLWLSSMVDLCVEIFYSKNNFFFFSLLMQDKFHRIKFFQINKINDENSKTKIFGNLNFKRSFWIQIRMLIIFFFFWLYIWTFHILLVLNKEILHGIKKQNENHEIFMSKISNSHVIIFCV